MPSGPKQKPPPPDRRRHFTPQLAQFLHVLKVLASLGLFVFLFVVLSYNMKEISLTRHLAVCCCRSKTTLHPPHTPPRKGVSLPQPEFCQKVHEGSRHVWEESATKHFLCCSRVALIMLVTYDFIYCCCSQLLLTVHPSVQTLIILTSMVSVSPAELRLLRTPPPPSARLTFSLNVTSQHSWSTFIL